MRKLAYPILLIFFLSLNTFSSPKIIKKLSPNKKWYAFIKTLKNKDWYFIKKKKIVYYEYLNQLFLGRVAYRKGKQIFLKPHQITRFNPKIAASEGPTGVQSFSWSPDSIKIAFHYFKHYPAGSPPEWFAEVAVIDIRNSNCCLVSEDRATNPKWLDNKTIIYEQEVLTAGKPFEECQDMAEYRMYLKSEIKKVKFRLTPSFWKKAKKIF